MAKESIRTESQMIEKVRRWRREAYEAEVARSPQQRADRWHELAREFGLPTAPLARSDTPARPR